MLSEKMTQAGKLRNTNVAVLILTKVVEVRTFVSGMVAGEALDWPRDGPNGCEPRIGQKYVCHVHRPKRRGLGAIHEDED